MSKVMHPMSSLEGEVHISELALDAIKELTNIPDDNLAVEKFCEVMLVHFVDPQKVINSLVPDIQIRKDF